MPFLRCVLLLWVLFSGGGPPLTLASAAVAPRVIRHTLFRSSPALRSVSVDPFTNKRVKREGARYLRHEFKNGKWEEPQNIEIEESYFSPEKFQVVSSSLRVLPRKTEAGRRRSKRSEGEWRKPRRHQFVTTGRVGKYLEPDPLRYYPEDRPYYRSDYPRRSPPRRIIYYATLPEIVRHPSDWSPPPRNDDIGYPSVQDNEVVTRVQSPVIDVMNNNRDKFERGHSSPKITIIDAEPPYYRYRPPYDPYFYNSYDGYRDRLNFPDPYGYYERRPPASVGYRNIIIPPLPNSFTVVRKPLDVRPLDPIKDITTTPPPKRSSTTTSTPATTTLNPIAKFERTFKY